VLVLSEAVLVIVLSSSDRRISRFDYEHERRPLYGLSMGTIFSALQFLTE
jgi:hypothetical protein